VEPGAGRASGRPHSPDVARAVPGGDAISPSHTTAAGDDRSDDRGRRQ
jgi:hypothetical protein